MIRSRRMLTGAMMLMLGLAPATAGAAGDEASGGEKHACLGAVGTFLLQRGVVIKRQNRVGRMLLSLTNGGHAIYVDSAESGIYGYQPFTDGQGAWRCVSEENGAEKIRVLLLDFTASTAREPEAKIARLDIEATLDNATGAMQGNVRLRFAPLAADPYDEEQYGKPLDYTFRGTRVTVP